MKENFLLLFMQLLQQQKETEISSHQTTRGLYKYFCPLTNPQEVCNRLESLFCAIHKMLGADKSLKGQLFTQKYQRILSLEKDIHDTYHKDRYILLTSLTKPRMTSCLNCEYISYSFYLFIWGFTSLSTLYRSYHDGQLEAQRKPVHRVRQGSVL